MTVSYLRRFRMEYEFGSMPLARPRLPEGYRWVSWKWHTLERHAAVKFLSFREDIDARFFECFRDYRGCHRLMRAIARQNRFVPGATWLIARCPFDEWSTDLDCATVQGLRRARYLGAIQNVGVVPEHRGLGLGRALVLKALHGFRSAGLRRVCLEVTAENVAATTLYESLGFRYTRTVYKSIEGEPEDRVMPSGV